MLSVSTEALPKSVYAVTAAGFQLKLFLFIIATNIKKLFTSVATWVIVIIDNFNN